MARAADPFTARWPAISRAPSNDLVLESCRIYCTNAQAHEHITHGLSDCEGHKLLHQLTAKIRIAALSPFLCRIQAIIYNLPSVDQTGSVHGHITGKGTQAMDIEHTVFANSAKHSIAAIALLPAVPLVL